MFTLILYLYFFGEPSIYIIGMVSFIYMHFWEIFFNQQTESLMKALVFSFVP